METLPLGPYAVDICGDASQSALNAAKFLVHGAAAADWDCNACKKELPSTTLYQSCLKGAVSDPSPSDYSNISDPVYDPAAECWQITGTFEGELTVKCQDCTNGYVPIIPE